jgi:hypothetical protein
VRTAGTSLIGKPDVERRTAPIDMHRLMPQHGCPLVGRWGVSTGRVVDELAPQL